jgi:hypothetical protein
VQATEAEEHDVAVGQNPVIHLVVSVGPVLFWLKRAVLPVVELKPPAGLMKASRTFCGTHRPLRARGRSRGQCDPRAQIPAG